MKAAQRNAQVKAGLAANGVDVNSGSAVDVEQSSRELGALDQATTAQRGAEQVYGYETQGTGYQAQSQLDNAEAPYDYAGGVLKGAGSILSAAPNIPEAYAWMSGKGAASSPVDLGFDGFSPSDLDTSQGYGEGA